MTQLLERLKRFASGLVGALASLAFLALLLLLPVAQCWAPAGAARALAESDLSIEEVDLTFEGDLRILTAVQATYELSQPGRHLELLIARSLELNAASFGSGRFVFWEGSADLPAAQLDALAAHEVAHDVLLHSLRAQDAAALVKFFAEVLSLFGRADQQGQENVQSWLATVTMPRYSRVQELEADAYAVGLLGEMGYEDSE